MGGDTLRLAMVHRNHSDKKNKLQSILFIFVWCFPVFPCIPQIFHPQQKAAQYHPRSSPATSRLLPQRLAQLLRCDAGRQLPQVLAQTGPGTDTDGALDQGQLHLQGVLLPVLRKSHVMWMKCWLNYKKMMVSECLTI